MPRRVRGRSCYDRFVEDDFFIIDEAILPSSSDDVGYDDPEWGDLGVC